MPRQSTPSQVPFEQVSADRLMADTQAIARWVRLSGTPEELEAARYVQGQLRRAGCRTRLLMHDAYISLPGPAALTLTAEGASREVACVTHSFAASTGPAGLEAEAVYAGGDPAGFAAAGVAGKVAVVDGLASPGVVAAAERAGAAGVVCLNYDPHVHEMIVSTIWGSPPLDALDRLPKIPVVSVAGRDAGPVREATRSGGARARLVTKVQTGWRTTPLVIGDLPGAVEETFVLFSGHLDSWHRGAMDNGTANATMLEIARILGRARRYRGVRFAFWSGHSHGRYSGSTWYADTFWHELNARCVAHVNVDSTGGLGAVVNRHAYVMPEARAVVEAAVRAVAGGRFEGTRPGRMGDQSFLGIGIPSLLMDISEQPGDSPHASRDFSVFSGGDTGGLGWWWHTTEDTPDKIDPALLVRDCRIYLGVVHTLATAPVLPLDYTATARAWLDALRAVAAGAARRVDVRPALAEARRLLRAAGALQRRGHTLTRTGDRRAIRALNQALMAMGRALIPVDYTQTGRFDHDPALPHRDPPRLAALRALARASGDEAKHLAVRAVRDLNAIRYALAQAAEIAERAATGAAAGPGRRAARRPAG